MAVKKKAVAELDVIRIETETLDCYILGTSPMYFNRLAEKAQHELLAPRGRRSSSADRAAAPKHDPIKEFQNSVHRNIEKQGRPKPAARLYFPSSGFKGTMMTAALDLPGTKKTEIGRLLFVEGDHVDIYGVPFLKMDGVRTADINRTPDIRTRAILPEWACKLRITYVKPKLNANAVVNLLVAGGITCGIGDFRQEKGKGSFGQFTVVNKDDERWKAIVKSQGLREQDRALATPEPYDDETDTLLTWFLNEQKSRGKAPESKGEE